MIRTLAIAILFLTLATGCRPSASEMKDHLEKLPEDASPTATREELIQNIGHEPDSIADMGMGCETWVWVLDGGKVELMVCQLNGKFYAQHKPAQ